MRRQLTPNLWEGRWCVPLVLSGYLSQPVGLCRGTHHAALHAWHPRYLQIYNVVSLYILKCVYAFTHFCFAFNILSVKYKIIFQDILLLSSLLLPVWVARCYRNEYWRVLHHWPCFIVVWVRSVPDSAWSITLLFTRLVLIICWIIIMKCIDA